MRKHILFSILFISIIKEILWDGGTIRYIFKIDLTKHDKVIVLSSDGYIIFDLSEFKKDEEIYFKNNCR